MDGMARPFGSGLEPESTGSGCWGKEEEKMTSMMRRRRWTGHPRKSCEARCWPLHPVSHSQARTQEHPYSSVLKPASTVCPLLLSGYDSRTPPSQFRFLSPTSTTTQSSRCLTSTLCLIRDVWLLSFLSLVAWLGFVNPPLPPSVKQPTEPKSDAIIPLTDRPMSYPTQLNPINVMELHLVCAELIGR